MSKKSAYKRFPWSSKEHEVQWRLQESQWLCTSIEHKKYMKEYLNRTYRRKSKQKRIDDDEE